MNAAQQRELAPTESPDDRWLTPEQAAEYLQVGKQHLANLRVKHRGDGLGPGPDHRRQGRVVRYKRSWLDAWMNRGHQTDTPSNVIPMRGRS